MIKTSIKKRHRVPMKALDPTLADKIKELRMGLGLLQAQFAQRLNVTQTQISEWEKGTKERPSIEKLLEMARFAQTSEAREWFWRKAGVDLESVKAHFREEVQARSDRWESGRYLRVPVVRELSVGGNGELMAREEGVLELPAREFPNPASIICLMNSDRPPWSLCNGTRIVVDRSVTDPRRLLGSMIAVYFEKFPPLDERVCGPRPPELELWDYLLKVDPGDRLGDTSERKQLLEEMMIEGHRPGFLVGRLDLNFADRSTPDFRRLVCCPSQLVLVLQAPVSIIDETIPLSNWEEVKARTSDLSVSLPALFPNDIRIIGQVVMNWFSVESGMPS